MATAVDTAKRRVLFVLPSFEIGGSQRVLLTLLRHLDRSRYAPELVVFDISGGLRDMVPADVPMHDLRRPRLRDAIVALWGTARHVRPHIIFSTLGYVNLAVLGMRRWLPGRPRIVVRESNLPSQALPALRHYRWIAAGYRALYPRADAIICQSHSIRKELTRDFGVRPAQAVLVRNPVDVESIRRRAVAATRAPGSGRRFVAAGHLIHQKGYDRLLEIFAQLPEAELDIYGDGAERANLEAQVRRLRLGARVRLPGFASQQLWSAMAGADCFVMPSRWEGMPNAALEALACGTPVLATPEAGGLTEVAEDAPPTAVTLAPMEAFLDALRQVVPRTDAGLRPTLLPPAFTLSRAVQEFERVLG